MQRSLRGFVRKAGRGLYFYAERFKWSVEPVGTGCGLYLEPARNRSAVRGAWQHPPKRGC